MVSMVIANNGKQGLKIIVTSNCSSYSWIEETTLTFVQMKQVCGNQKHLIRIHDMGWSEFQNLAISHWLFSISMKQNFQIRFID